MGLLGDIGDGLKDVGGAIKDGVNDGLGKLEDGIDEGKKLVGEGVDWGTNKVGEGLDKVGLHDAADAVEDWGDDVASDLGATPGEQQLGQTEEADELVHGNPDKILESSKHLKDFHTAFDHVGAGMRKVDSSGWAGEGGDAFRKKFGVHPTKWAQAADACETASGALDAYAGTVKWAQGKAKEAVELYKKGTKTSKDAVDAYNKRVDAYNGKVKANEDPGPKPEPFQDPGKADIKKAHEMLAEARKQRNTAASEAQGKVKAALAHAPAEPPPLDRIGNDLVDGYQAVNTELTHVVGGALKGTAGLVNFARGLNPTDPYNLTHPAAYLQNVSMTLSGLVSTAAHPERIVTSAVDGFKKDPSEFVGRLLPELIGTKGAGLARSGLRLGLKTGLKEGAENAVRREARNAVEHDPHSVGRKPDEITCREDPVDVATGHVVLPQTDIALPGVLPLEIRRRYLSGYRCGARFGASWSSTLDQRLEIDSEGVVFVGEDGLVLSYPHPAPGVPTYPRTGPRHPLDRIGDEYTLTDTDSGQVRHFADSGTHIAPLIQITDRNSNWITLDHDENGHPISVTHHGGYRLLLGNVDGRITTLSLVTGASDTEAQVVARYDYSPQRDLTAIVNSTGSATRFGYDDHHRITSWTDTNDQSFSYVYDEHDRCVRQGGEAGHEQSTFTYTPPDPADGSRTTTITNSFGHRSRFLINKRSQVTAEITPLGATTRYLRDAFNRLLQHTDPLGHTMTFEYDSAGHLVTVTRPDGRTARAEYNELGQPVRVINPDGTITRYAYDARGNLTATTSQVGQTTGYTHDEAGRLTSVTDPQGCVTTLTNNQAGLAVHVTDSLGAVTRYERDAFGRITATTDPDGATSRTDWTTEGNLARHTAPDGSVETWTYDGEGNCTSHTDPRGAISRYEYTHFDLLSSRTGPDGAQLHFRHDTELRLTGVTNAQGQTWSYEYDADGNLTAETDFDDRRLTYAYDAAGNLTSRTNASGQSVLFEHNFLGQVTRKNADGQITEYSYDLTDQLAQATNAQNTLTLLRDQFGRLHSETVNERTLRYTYDAHGRLEQRQTPTGASTRWHYDTVGRPVQMTVGSRQIDFAYDSMGRETSRQVGSTMALTNTFGTTGRLSAQTITTPRAQQPRHRRYTYRTDGLLTGIDDSVTGTRRVDLDATGRVTAINAANWNESYTYDSSGNQTHASWPANHPGHESAGPRSFSGTRLTRAGTTRFEYDAMGRVTLRQKTRLSRKPESWRYQWDVEDRLVSVITPDGTLWRYTYDPLGRRTSKLRMTDDGSTVAERTRFTWDGTTLCEQITDAPDLPGPVVLTWDHQGLLPLSQTERVLSADSRQEVMDSRFFAIITDLVGTPSELLDEHGNTAWQARSTLWGTTAWARTSTTYTPLRFPGQYYDPETGLHYNHFRHYDPETARYLTPDPLGLAPAPNPVTYVHNPHLWTDPFGLTPCDDAAKNAQNNKTTPLGKEIPTREEGSVGSTTDHKYKRTFFNEHPELKGKVVVHHAIEQQVLKRYPGLFSPDEIHSLENLRGIPKGDINSKVHLSDIRVSWNEFYRTHPNPTRQEVLDHVTHVDDRLGNWFSPRIR